MARPLAVTEYGVPAHGKCSKENVGGWVSIAQDVCLPFVCTNWQPFVFNQLLPNSVSDQLLPNSVSDQPLPNSVSDQPLLNTVSDQPLPNFVSDQPLCNTVSL